MIKKTKDYDSFIFRPDNREKIDQSHIKKLIASIQSKNLLELRPIMVNEKMEIIDGQHRLLAAKELGVEIFYQMEKKLDASDVIKINIAKAWGLSDYLNFYCVHEKPEYIKLKDFIVKNRLHIKSGISVFTDSQGEGIADFRNGNFIFKQEILPTEIDLCWETIDLIAKINGRSSVAYTKSGRFWKALLLLLKNPDFDEQKWRRNLERHISTCGPRANFRDYLKMFEKIYNWNNQNPISLTE